MMARRMANARFLMTIWAATGVPVTAFPLFGRRFVAGVGDGREQRGERRLVDDLGPTSGEIDFDGGNTWDFAEGRVDVFDASIAGHAGDLQGGDHVATVA
jgi:hypothetical protein